MREIVLIDLTGEGRPGLTAAVAAAMLQPGVKILDISQAVAHRTIILSLVLQVLEAEQAGPVYRDMQRVAQSFNLQLQFSTLSELDYRQRAAEQGGSEYILSLMARQISAEQLHRVASILANYGLKIEQIKRLSAPAELAAVKDAEQHCIAFALSGECSAQALRAELLAAAQELGVDLVLQDDPGQRSHRRLAVFDMDSTLIQAEVIDELAKAAGVGEQVAQITARAMRGELDFRASFKERLALLKGLDVSVLDSIGASLRLSEGAERLFAELKRLGYKTAILSGGFSYFAKQLQARLGIDYVFANELQVLEGKLSGVVVEPIVDAQRKADLLRELALKEGLSLEQTIAVGDGANDLPMLAIAGLGVAFHAKPLVRQSAKHAISTLGLDALLYLLGVPEREWAVAGAE